MAYFLLTYADGTEEVVAVSGEARLDVKPGHQVTFDSQTGLVDVVYSEDKPETKAAKKAAKEAEEEKADDGKKAKK